MAEERLIDDDEDRNLLSGRKPPEGGEDAESESGGEMYFGVSEDFVQDDERLMTPEQRALQLEAEKKEREERLAEAERLIKAAVADCESDKFSTALEYLDQAEELDGENGLIYATRLRAYTRNFTDYSHIRDAAESAEGIKNYASEELKAQIKGKAGVQIDKKIASLRSEVSALNERNESEKAERAVTFKRDRNIALIIFCCLFAVFAAGLALSIYYAGIIYTIPNNTYLIATFVCAGVAVVFFLLDAISARRLAITWRRVRLNKRNTSTELGRNLLEKQAELKAFIEVRDSLGEVK